jgi:hypothetical protein
MIIQDPYLHFSLEDFFWDERFRTDVMNGGKDFAYWEQWVKQYPDKEPIIKKARLLILSVYIDNTTFQEDEVQELVRDTQRILQQDNIEDKLFIEVAPVKTSYKYLVIAASILLMAVMGGIWIKQKNSVNLSFQPTYENLIKESPNLLIEKVNQTNAPLIITLPDGTRTTLSTKSKISYPEKFIHLEKREVFLVGEAFFEVVRNTQKPFLVYADGLVTKVLGTKFRVRSYAIDKEVVVEVASGRVSVFTNPRLVNTEKKGSNELSSIVLIPNQKVSFLKSDASIVKTLVNEPILLKPEKNVFKLINFDDTPINTVFAILKDVYGIDIVFDEELLADCTLNANLEGYNLYEQLNIICKALNGNYEVLDGRVIINAKGCSKK